ncbi:hypothetical protein BDK51DRAFT_25490 [Blyttiomyces helicus]|uniref:Uncharacterized protein n=1 Tax=Blyttiomyces helicus TaxID=388810 RepID=A0A4P9WMD4_9FUNG|nr:hypothetical protein BDK51DRAFT_25490 [Blyttiomyces helicus]|eukprot:RKO94229.1 hypothetical protein BDK51DRAFT_25490 [Blyttiomyces helicus]
MTTREDKEDFEEASREEINAKANNYKDYSNGSSSVKGIKRLKAKTVTATPSKLLRYHRPPPSTSKSTTTSTCERAKLMKQAELPVQNHKEGTSHEHQHATRSYPRCYPKPHFQTTEKATYNLPPRTRQSSRTGGEEFGGCVE